MTTDKQITEKVKNTLIRAASTYRDDQKEAFRRAIGQESSETAKWALEQLLANADAAEKNAGPLCDDTGIPHLFLEVGSQRTFGAGLLEEIQQGVAIGLRELPGRPMAVKGDDRQRLDQSGGLDADPGALEPAPILIKPVSGDVLRLHVLMQGGGPEIRGKTYRVFHRHSVSAVIDEVTGWAVEAAGQLGCTPCVPAIGIGRTHFEASSLMIEAMIRGNFGVQSDLEREITDKINRSQTGPLGLGGSATALATFLKVGPQRASGVRIVCMRLCCCMEPRVASVDL